MPDLHVDHSSVQDACRSWLAAHGHNFDAIWQQIEELVVLSLLSVQPLLQLNYRTAFPATDSGFSCFELLGYDVLLDEKCRPWLLEVCSTLVGMCISTRSIWHGGV